MMEFRRHGENWRAMTGSVYRQTKDSFGCTQFIHVTRYMGGRRGALRAIDQLIEDESLFDVFAAAN